MARWLVWLFVPLGCGTDRLFLSFDRIGPGRRSLGGSTTAALPGETAHRRNKRFGQPMLLPLDPKGPLLGYGSRARFQALTRCLPRYPFGTGQGSCQHNPPARAVWSKYCDEAKTVCWWDMDLSKWLEFAGPIRDLRGGRTFSPTRDRASSARRPTCRDLRTETNRLASVSSD